MKDYSTLTHNFDIDDAKKYGLTKAVVLYTLKNWIVYKNRIKGGLHQAEDEKYYYFAYASGRALQEQMPYLSDESIRKALKSLVDDGVLIIGEFNKLKYDRTKWYALSSMPIEIDDSTIDIEAVMETTDVGIHSTDCGMETTDVGNDTISSDISSDISFSKLTPNKISQDFFNNVNSEYRLKALEYLLTKGLSEETIKSEMLKFISYWTELTGSGRKQRWETQKTFEVNRRLATWFSNISNFNQTNKHKIGIV